MSDDNNFPFMKIELETIACYFQCMKIELEMIIYYLKNFIRLYNLKLIILSVTYIALCLTPM